MVHYTQRTSLYTVKIHCFCKQLSIHITVYTVHCSLYTSHSYSMAVQYTQHSLSLHCSMYTENSTLYTLHRGLFNIHCSIIPLLFIQVSEVHIILHGLLYSLVFLSVHMGNTKSKEASLDATRDTSPVWISDNKSRSVLVLAH